MQADIVELGDTSLLLLGGTVGDGTAVGVAVDQLLSLLNDRGGSTLDGRGDGG